MGKRRIKGAGGGHGTGGFIAQRVTAIAILFLGPWFIINLALITRDNSQSPLAFLSVPLNAGLAAAFLVAGCWHMQIGMREIIEDYIDKESTRHGLEFLNGLVALAAAAAGLYGLAKISLGV